jgi:Meckel syndrome type 1 protein
MLDAQQARTATAEGRSPEDPAAQAPDAAPVIESSPPDPKAGTPVDQDASSSPAPEDAASLAAAVFAALAVPVTSSPTAAPAPAGPEAAPVSVAAQAVPTVAPAVGVVADALPVADVAAPAAAAPAAPGATPAPPAAGETAPATVQPPPATASTGTPAAAAPAPKLASSGQAPADTSGQGAQGQSQPDSQQPQPVVGAYTRPAEPPRQQVAQPAAAPVSAAPAAPTAPAAAAAPADAPHPALPVATPVPLARSAEAVEHVLRLASGRGVTHARIALRPAELGSVDVHLRSTAEGIVARVVAQSPEAVQTLQHAANDLRRALEEQGLNVLNLDISQSGERFAGRTGSDAGELASGQREAPDGRAGDAEETTTQTSMRLPTGVLVDVLA